MVRAAAQQTGTKITALPDAKRELASLARKLRERGDGKRFPSQHELYLICQFDDKSVLKVVTSTGALQDDPEAAEILGVVDKVREQARVVGLTQYLAGAGGRGLGGWPLLLTIGNERESVGGTFRWGSRTISMVPGTTPHKGSSIIFHETAHFVLGTAPALNDLEARGRFARSYIVSLLNEAFAYTLEYAAAYALHLNGDSGIWNSLNNLGFNGTLYRSIVRTVAEQFPDLKEQLQRDGRVSDAFLAKVFEALVEAPGEFYLGEIKSDSFRTFAANDAREILPRIYFLDKAGQDRVLQIVSGSAWFGGIKQGKREAALVKAANELDLPRMKERRVGIFRGIRDGFARIEQRPSGPHKLAGAYELWDWYLANEKNFEAGLLPGLGLDESGWTALRERLETAAMAEARSILTALDIWSLPSMAISDLRFHDIMDSRVFDWARKQADPRISAEVFRDLRDKSLRISCWFAHASWAETDQPERAKFLVERLLNYGRDFTTFRRSASDQRTGAEIAKASGMLDQLKLFDVVTIRPNGVAQTIATVEAMTRLGVTGFGQSWTADVRAATVKKVLASWREIEKREPGREQYATAYATDRELQAIAGQVDGDVLSALQLSRADWDGVQVKLRAAALQDGWQRLRQLDESAFAHLPVGEMEEARRIGEDVFQWLRAAKDEAQLKSAGREIGGKHDRLRCWIAYRGFDAAKSPATAKRLAEITLNMGQRFDLFRTGRADTRSARELAAASGFLDHVKSVATFSVNTSVVASGTLALADALIQMRIDLSAATAPVAKALANWREIEQRGDGADRHAGAYDVHRGLQASGEVEADVLTEIGMSRGDWDSFQAKLHASALQDGWRRLRQLREPAFPHQPLVELEEARRIGDDVFQWLRAAKDEAQLKTAGREIGLAYDRLRCWIAFRKFEAAKSPATAKQLAEVTLNMKEPFEMYRKGPDDKRSGQELAAASGFLEHVTSVAVLNVTKAVSDSGTLPLADGLKRLRLELSDAPAPAVPPQR